MGETRPWLLYRNYWTVSMCLSFPNQPRSILKAEARFLSDLYPAPSVVSKNC